MVDLNILRSKVELLDLAGYPMHIKAREVLELLDMLEAAQKDAARYQFLRDGNWRDSAELEPVIRLQLNVLWDEAIDAAMTTTKD